MSENRTALARVAHISAALTVRKRTTAGMLAVELEVSDKTIRRDLEFMRDQLGLPVDRDVAGFYFTAPVHLCRACGRRTRSKP